jgi:hypothetical protein
VKDLAQTGPSPSVIVDPFNVDDIAAGLVAASTDETLRVELTARGREHAGSRTWRTAARRHIRLWESLA